MIESASDKRRPRVLHVIDSLDISGGAEKQLVANLQSFDHDLMIHEVAVIKQTDSNREADVTPFAPLHCIVPAGVNPSRKQVISGLRSLVRERNPALIHASLPDSALATRVVARTDGVKAVESLVNISHERVRTVDNPHVTPSKLLYHRMLDRLTMSSLAGFHAVSQAVADSWANVVGLDPKKMQVIPRGIDIASVGVPRGEDTGTRRSVLAEFDLPGETTLAIAVGRVEPQKGHRYLIEAVGRLTKDQSDLRVLIVGRKGHASPAVEALVEESGLGDIVKFTGSRRDLPRLLAAADMFVFPSLFEGNGGNAMIEAMASGLPVITTGAPPMTDLIPDADVGLLVDRFDSAGLAEAIARLCDDPGLRRSLGDAARERARGFPSPEDVAAMHEAWYQDLVSA